MPRGTSAPIAAVRTGSARRATTLAISASTNPIPTRVWGARADGSTRCSSSQASVTAAISGPPPCPRSGRARPRRRRPRPRAPHRPPQPWLDGFKPGKATISQFVAMPLGQGVTVEAQLTGGESIGGLQLLVAGPVPGVFPTTPPRPRWSPRWRCPRRPRRQRHDDAEGPPRRSRREDVARDARGAGRRPGDLAAGLAICAAVLATRAGSTDPAWESLAVREAQLGGHLASLANPTVRRHHPANPRRPPRPPRFLRSA